MRTAALANPLGSLFALALCVGDTNGAAKADDVAEAERLQEREQLLITEATVGQDGHMAIRWQGFGQPTKAGILVVVAPGCDLVLPDRKPDQRRCAA